LRILRLISGIILIILFAANVEPARGAVYSATVNEDADTLRGVTLREVVVKRTKEKYSKRNNPAVDFVNKIRNARHANDPRRNAFYNYTKFERITFGLHDFHVVDSTKAGGRPGKFAFLKDFVDTLDATGVPVLPLSVKEKVSKVIYRRQPEAEKEIVTAIRSNGVDDIADMQNIQTMVEDVFREVDLYDNNINLLQNRFVSPLSGIAPDFYKFYLTDTVKIDDTRCIVLSFAPRNPATFGFLGRIYVEEGDTTMFVRRVDMGVSPTINLNFIDKLKIIQEYKKAPDGSRLKTLDEFNAIIKVFPGAPAMYARRATGYTDHNFTPSPLGSYFDQLGDTFTEEEAESRTDTYWQVNTSVAPMRNESRMKQLLTDLRSVPLYRYTERFVKLMVVGYVTTGKESKFDIGPLNTFISGNSVEGVRLRAGGITTANLSPHWFARGYVAYGTRDNKWKYNAELEYSFNSKKYHSREFPIHSIRVNRRYDIDQLGQHYMFTNADNMFLAFKRGENHLITYKHETSLTYQLELANNLSFTVGASHERQERGPWVPFLLTDGGELNHFDETLFTFQLRYAPGEKFYQTKSSRIPINLDPWVVVLSHTYAPRGFLGSRYGVNKTELSVQKRFWFSAFGFADIILKGGHVWNRTSYFHLLTPNANLSYTIQPESFALMNPLEFINDSYVSWDVTYWANGALFNYIPLLKKLKLREVVAFRGWLGKLTAKNDPVSDIVQGSDVPLLLFPTEALATPMNRRPYMEISAGIDNFLKCLRIDYVWRLSYRNMPGVNRSGLRIAFHVTF